MEYQTDDPNSFASRIRIGEWTRVGLEPPLANRIRRTPGGEVVGMAPPGTVLYVLDGPVCRNGYLYWYVRTADRSLEGWTSEIGPEGYWYLDAGSVDPP